MWRQEAGASVGVRMNWEEFDTCRWVDRVTVSLADLDRVHKPYLDAYRLHASHELAVAENRYEAGFPLDDARMLYAGIRHNMAFAKEAYSEPLRTVLDQVRHALLSHPTLEPVVVSGRNVGENDFYMRILDSGGSISASDLIAGLMARAADLPGDRFRKAARELNAFLSPVRDGEMDDVLGNLDEGCDILPFYGLAVTERIDLCDGMAIFPYQEILRFLDEESLQELSPSDAAFHDHWCGGAFAWTFRWRPAFRRRGHIDEPLTEPPQSLLLAARQFLDLIAVSHATPVLPLALISGRIDRLAARLLGRDSNSLGIYQKWPVSAFNGLTECPTIKKKELDETLEAFNLRESTRFSRLDPLLSRLAASLDRNGRFADEVRALDVAIVLEGMYELPRDKKTRKLASRVADFLGKSEEDRRRLENNVIRFYDARSEIVHSVSEGVSPFRNDAAFVTGFALARRSLFKLLGEGFPDDWNKLETVDN